MRGCRDNPGLTLTTPRLHNGDMAPREVADEDRQTFERLHEVRAKAVDHFQQAVEYSRQRRTIITELMEAGYSQADIGREMGVTRQAVRKMLKAV